MIISCIPPILLGKYVLFNLQEKNPNRNRLFLGCLPSDGCVLFVGVPVEPFNVQRSVGENSGSLIGPLGTKGVRIADGDWSMPRL